MWRGRKDDVKDITPLSCNSIAPPATPEKMAEGKFRYQRLIQEKTFGKLASAGFCVNAETTTSVMADAANMVMTASPTILMKRVFIGRPVLRGGLKIRAPFLFGADGVEVGHGGYVEDVVGHDR